jgi:hypothetical protein
MNIFHHFYTQYVKPLISTNRQIFVIKHHKQNPQNDNEDNGLVQQLG